MNTMATTMLTRIMPTTTILTMVKITIAHKVRLVTSHSLAPTNTPVEDAREPQPDTSRPWWRFWR